MTNLPERQSVSDRHITALIEILGVLPEGRWTTYGELAKLLNTSPIVVGRYIADPRLPNAHRVLKARGEIAEGFHWGELGRSDDPRALLESEGVAFNARNQADSKQRIRSEQLRDLLGDRSEVVLGPVARVPALGRRSRPAVPIQPVPDGGVAAMEQALAGRADLRRPMYGANARLLFAAELILDIPDIHTVAAEALIDGSDDKSCDFLYVDTDAGLVVIAQGYETERIDKPVANGLKARNLHESATWVLSHDLVHVPDRIRPAIVTARQVIANGEISEVRVWLVHNLPESLHIDSMLRAVETTCQDALTSNYPDLNIDVRAEEIGRHRLADWYRASMTPILVTDEFAVDVETYLEESSRAWSAYSVTVPANWLQGVYWHHGDRLFSANVRGFLGKRKKINTEIRRTLEQAPQNFWIFNNGVTALVNDAKYDPDTKRLLINGLSIVNGAQTTGALGEFEKPEALSDARIPMRFIICSDRSTVHDIIRYTNRQNPTEAADFRSNDRVQRRLVQEFAELGVTGYTGGRRGGDARPAGEFDVETTSAAKALAAFHGHPGIAHSRARLIWEDDAQYGRLFSDATTAPHILFCWGMLRAIEQYKGQLRVRQWSELPQGKQNQRKFLDLPGSIPLLVAAVGDCLEDLLDRQVPHSFRLAFRGSLSAADTIAAWGQTVEKLSYFAHRELRPVLAEGGLSREFDPKSLLEGWRTRVQSVAGDWETLRETLREQIVGWR